MATARRLISFGISQGIYWWSDYTVFFIVTKLWRRWWQWTAAIILLTPANFYQFWRQKINFQPLSFTFEAFGKKLAETKIVARVNLKKIKAKKLKKAFTSPAVKRQQFFTKICQWRWKSAVFWPLLRLCWNAMSKNIFLMSCLNRFRSLFPKKYNFYALLLRYFAGEFCWLQKFNKSPK